MTATTGWPDRPTGAFGDLCRAEWVKIRSVRWTCWVLAAMAAVSIGFTALYAARLASGWATMTAVEQRWWTSDSAAMLLQPGATFGQLAMAVLGVLVMTSEYSTGTIRLSVLATPRRTPLLAAKAVVVGGVGFTAGVAVAVPSFLVGAALTSDQLATSMAAIDSWRAILGFGLHMALTAVIALAIGTIVRHPAAGLGAVAGLNYVVPLLLTALGGSVSEHVFAALPAASVIMSNGQNGDDLYSPLTSLAFLLAWTVALLAPASVLLKRRDVS